MKTSLILPRIRLTKTNGAGRAIIPIAAISGIEESKTEKCTRICTFDGFWYEVTNSIQDIDKKIEKAEFGEDAVSEQEEAASPPPEKGRAPVAATERKSLLRSIIRKTASAAEDKSPRRLAEIEKPDAAHTSEPDR